MGFSAERRGQSDCIEVYNRDPIGLKIPKTGVITVEPPYHAQVWEYPPRGTYTHTSQRDVERIYETTLCDIAIAHKWFVYCLA